MTANRAARAPHSYGIPRTTASSDGARRTKNRQQLLEAIELGRSWPRSSQKLADAAADTAKLIEEARDLDRDDFDAMLRRKVVDLGAALGIQGKHKINGKWANKAIADFRDEVFDALDGAPPTKTHRTSKQTPNRRHKQVLRRGGKGELSTSRAPLASLKSY